MDTELSLDRHGPLGRFDALVEADYQRWLERHLLPLATAMALTSIGAWVTGPPFAHLLAASSVDLSAIYLVCWGINIPVLALGLAWVRRRAGLGLVNLGVLAIALTAADSILVIAPAIDAGPIAYITLLLFYGSLAPAVQLPFRQTVTLGVFISVIAFWRWLAQDDAVWNVEQGTLALTGVIAVLLINPTVAWTGERGLRKSFADEQTIAQQRQLIRRYAPSSVVSRIELGDHTVDHPQRRKVTVFFSDVVGFTTMADRVDPEALAEIVNDYLGALSELIERHGGTLNEFAGDGVMALFGAPDEMAPTAQVQAAIAAAQELQTSLPEWSRDWYQHGIIEDAQARVGINTGTVSVGTFGSAIRATYTGIGLQTNIAARVQTEAKPGGILLSNTSWHLVKDTIECEPRGEVMVKGVHFPIELYEPL